MATKKPAPAPSLTEKIKSILGLLSIIATVLTSAAGGGFYLGKMYEETQSNLKATQALQSCNERIEQARVAAATCERTKNIETIVELQNIVQLIKGQQDGKK